MGGKDNRKLVSFRANDNELAAIERLIAASGLTKQEYLLKAVLGTTNTHTPNADSSLKASHSRDLKLLSADASSKPESNTTLRGVEAEKAIIAGQLVQLKDKQKVLVYDGWLWLVSKTANGSQKVINKHIQLPNGWARAFSDSGLDLPSLSEILGNIAFYKKLEATCDSSGALIEDIVSPSWLILFVNEQQRSEFLLKAAQKPTMVVADEDTWVKLFGEPVSLSEVASNEIPAEVVEVAPSPINEPVEEAVEPAQEVAPLELTNQDIKDRYQLTSGQLKKANEMAKASGYMGDDGLTWFKTDTASGVRWTTEQPRVVAQQLSLAV